MALFFYLVRVAVSGVRIWVNDLRRYPELPPEQRHAFWKKLQVAACLALLPAFLALGAFSRLARLLPAVKARPSPPS